MKLSIYLSTLATLLILATAFAHKVRGTNSNHISHGQNDIRQLKSGKGKGESDSPGKGKSKGESDSSGKGESGKSKGESVYPGKGKGGSGYGGAATIISEGANNQNNIIFGDHNWNYAIIEEIQGGTGGTDDTDDTDDPTCDYDNWNEVCFNLKCEDSRCVYFYCDEYYSIECGRNGPNPDDFGCTAEWDQNVCFEPALQWCNDECEKGRR